MNIGLNVIHMHNKIIMNDCQIKIIVTLVMLYCKIYVRYFICLSLPGIYFI